MRRCGECVWLAAQQREASGCASQAGRFVPSILFSFFCVCVGSLQQATEFVQERDESLVDHMVSNLGFGMGIEFRESRLLINARSTVRAKAGMVFNLQVCMDARARACVCACFVCACFVCARVFASDRGWLTTTTPPPLRSMWRW